MQNDNFEAAPRAIAGREHEIHDTLEFAGVAPTTLEKLDSRIDQKDGHDEKARTLALAG